MLSLTSEEKAWLAGAAGPALQRAMEIVVALGQIYGAQRLVEVSSVQISGVSYRNIGAAGLRFVQRWADEGARVRVPTTLNPAAMDLEAWDALGFAPTFAAQQQAVIAAFARMGVNGGHPIPTCTPYLVGNLPGLGEHVAWAESSAVSYANSVLGARTNREGGPGAIAAALTGRTAAYGLHLDEQRRASLLVEVRAAPREVADYSALGALIGKVAGPRVVALTGLALTRGEPLWEEKLKALGAAMAATGAVALYHVAGVTPEALETLPLTAAPERLAVDDWQTGYAALSDTDAPPDLVWIGCPHASLAEIAQVAAWLEGRTLRCPLWMTCARPVLEAARAAGYEATIRAAGGRLLGDACVAIAPVRDLGFKVVATSSAKGAYYLRNLARVAVRFAPLEACLRLAL